MINYKLTDKQVQYFMIASACILLVICAFLLGVLSVDENDCTDIRRDRDLAIERVQQLESDKVVNVGRVERDVKTVQKQLCREQIEQFKQEYKALRCKICTGENK